MKITFNYHKNTLSIYLAKNIDLETIPEFLNHILKLPLNVITSRTTGEILKRVDELNNIKNLFIEVFITIINSLFLILSSTIFLYYISNQLFLILCVISILYIIVGLISGPLIYKKINDNIDLETEFNSNLSENISNIESIKNLNITNNTIDSLDYTYTEYQKNTLEYSTFMNNLEVIKSIINDLGLFTITSYGIYQISLSKLNLLSLITFNSLISYFIEPIENIINLLPKYHLIQLSFSKISDFLSIDEEKLGHEEKFSIGTISFKNISYSYDDCQNILNNLSLTINKNSHIIIKGHTGCGKSTLFKMLNRTIDDYEGTITINDINIKDYSLKTLRKNILYVSQREKIFTETIYKNIVLNNKISKEKLNTILSITKVEEILDKKAMRLDSILYDSGFNLSGGERQRIILARAMVANPSILILDESLSEIDNISENFILKNINTYLKNTTIIYISHTNTNSFKNIIEMDKLK